MTAPEKPGLSNKEMTNERLDELERYAQLPNGSSLSPAILELVAEVRRLEALIGQGQEEKDK